MEKRPESGVWGGLWSFPEVPDTLTAEEFVVKICEVANFHYEKLPPKKHQFTHFKMVINPLLFTLKDNSRVPKKSDRMFVDEQSLENLGVPKPVQALLDNMWFRKKENT